MNTNVQNNLDYARVAEAIEYIRANFKRQPTLEEVAREVCLSPAHFQRLFTRWAGVSPKKFLQYISIEYAKTLLRDNSLSITTYKTGLSAPSRLHDLFVNIEGMTPGQYKNGGVSLTINYSFTQSPFGDILTAATSKGICHMAFSEDPQEAISALRARFPNARYTPCMDGIQQSATTVFTQLQSHPMPQQSNPTAIKLHLRGTDFQLKVWQALLAIPLGQLTTYSQLAAELQHPNAARAVGTAVGSNPVAFLIPCHRVIRSSGELGGYHWGLTRKSAIIGWEASRHNLK